MLSRRLLQGSLLVGTLSVLYYTQFSRVKEEPQEMRSRIPAHPARLFKSADAKQALQKALTENAEIVGFNHSRISAVHINAVASNPKMEDRHSISEYGDTLMFSVHDGHSGQTCAESLKLKLNSAIYNQLADGAAGIKKACLELDKSFTHALLDGTGPLESVESALTGAVSATAIVKDNKLTTAHTGDVRIVVGSMAGVSFATEDHNPEDNKKENARLKSEHPGEPYVVYSGRVLGGLMPSRAFGDGNYKWSIKEMRKLKEILTLSSEPGAKLSLRKLQPPPHYATPPYVTAEPEVSEVNIKPSDQFIILASDGLFDRMSSEQAVSFMQEYLKNGSTENAAVYLTRKAIEQVPAGIKVPEHMTKDEFVQAMSEQLMELPASKSRRYRDDITVLVVLLKDQAKL